MVTTEAFQSALGILVEAEPLEDIYSILLITTSVIRGTRPNKKSGYSAYIVISTCRG